MSIFKIRKMVTNIMNSSYSQLSVFTKSRCYNRLLKVISFLSSKMCLAFILIGVLMLSLIYWLVTKNYTYWKDRNVPYLEADFFFGSIKNQILCKKPWRDFSENCYKKFKNNKFGGAFFLNAPVLYVCDLKLMEKILIEDFSFFQDRWLQGNEDLSHYLTFGRGEKWRNTRLRLAPAFGAGKVKGMFQQIFTVTDRTLRQIDKHIEEPIEVEFLATSFSTEIIVSCMFGVDMSNFLESVQLRNSIDKMYNLSKTRSVIMILSMIQPKLLSFLKVQMASKEVIQTFRNLIKGIIVFRIENKTRRNDILQTMLDLQEQVENSNLKTSKVDSGTTESHEQSRNVLHKNEEIKFTHTSIGSLMMNFLSAGIKPTAITIKFALFEIARNPDIQNRVQKDIDSLLAKYKGWNYDALDHMTYLDQAIQETLRLYSFNGTLMRTLTKAYKLPGTNLILEKDMHVFIPIDAIHKDPEFYPQPEEFRPDRFQDHNYKPTSTFLPFGQGPRICVSIRLALTMVKLCVARILARYDVKISSRMQLPLELSNHHLYPKAKNGVWLEFEKRENSV